MAVCLSIALGGGKKLGEHEMELEHVDDGEGEPASAALPWWLLDQHQFVGTCRNHTN